REWTDTFQQLPAFIDERMAALGARRLHDRGVGDAAGDFDGQFEDWGAQLWPAVGAALGVDVGEPVGATTQPRYRVEFVPGNRQSPFVAAFDARPMPVLISRELTSRRDIQTLLEHTEYPWTRDDLAALLNPADDGRAYREEVLARRRSVLDLLEEHPACQVPFAVFLQLLGPLAPRYYSISSSPRVDPRRCSITVGALTGRARSGRGAFEGVCSNYLCRQGSQQIVYGFIRDTASAFRLP